MGASSFMLHCFLQALAFCLTPDCQRILTTFLNVLFNHDEQVDPGSQDEAIEEECTNYVCVVPGYWQKLP